MVKMNNNQTKKLIQTGLMLALALMFQIGFASFSQVLVGPLVNMVLFLTVLLIGPVAALFVGVITPLVAFMVGIMTLFPLVPVIGMGNGILVLLFYLIQRIIKSDIGKIVGVIGAAFFKFVFLAFSVRVILPLFVMKVPPVLVAALSFNQFITALVGGIIAFGLYKILKRFIK
jgi:predicted membrane protein